MTAGISLQHQQHTPTVSSSPPTVAAVSDEQHTYSPPPDAVRNIDDAITYLNKNRLRRTVTAYGWRALQGLGWLGLCVSPVAILLPWKPRLAACIASAVFLYHFQPGNKVGVHFSYVKNNKRVSDTLQTWRNKQLIDENLFYFWTNTNISTDGTTTVRFDAAGVEKQNPSRCLTTTSTSTFTPSSFYIKFGNM